MTTPSGPGQFSQRTDRAVSAASESLPNSQYGENKDYQEQKAGAPMAGGEAAPGMNIEQMLAGMQPETIPMDAETQMPDVPVTDGAALGPGAGTEALGLEAPVANKDQLRAYLPALEYMANRPNTSDSARNLVRKLKADLGM